MSEFRSVEPNTPPLPRRLKLVGAPTLKPQAQALAADYPASGLRWARRYRDRLRLTDVSIIFSVVVAVGLVGFFSSDALRRSELLAAEYATVTALVLGAWLLTLAAFHTRAPHVVGVGALEYKRVVNASALAFGLLAITFLVLQVNVARGYFIIALPIGIACLVLDRWLWRKWLLHQRSFGHYLARAIVVGKREDVSYVISQIESKSGAAFHVVGVSLQDGASEFLNVGTQSVPVVSGLAGIAQAAEAVYADTVIVAGNPDGGSEFIRNLGWDLEGTAAELVLSSRLTDVAGPRIHFRPVEGLPLIHVEIPSFEGGKHILKRTLDVTLAALALVALFPLMVAIAVVVKLDSPGPVLFRQERCGRNGRSFQMLKFRSMVQTAEDDLAGLLDQNEGAGVLFKLRNDPRVTRAGRVLRKYSLDELPQIWNALVGDMSVVGPRPPLATEVESYEGSAHRRLFIKPGITGLWQISGRSDLSWEESIRLDLYYVENWSLTGDVMIIWRTFRTVISPRGAY
ncbi:sugar transferase [Microterricola viridarii]|uniref:Undecaprenyl-phosphate galactose phosphotransferase, WbaP/exopolysaccharide biosynthesis polyprenyl glycosylphosphotransferase n=1 Tax=Microterricola viridarii TaxID=412690 RepID=A0A1H1PA94_9MICO|nr:sugar transferase [Microterricola viridarii]SDS08171.1 Undecaprenyl-phosphate galactose phosphotransferase, WbaP/exopolysaccharide biosynthesis polyprenyl glycosylphosphotransferase [Microterricola viridarii]